MEHKDHNDDDDGQHAVDRMLRQWAATTKRRKAEGADLNTPEGLAARADAISSELRVLLPYFDPESPRSLPSLCNAAVTESLHGIQLGDVLDDETEQRMIVMGRDIEALSIAFRDSATLLRDAARANTPAEKIALKKKAAYWVKELNDRAPAMLNMVQFMRDTWKAFDRRIAENARGTTPWEQHEREQELYEALQAMQDMPTEELKAMLKEGTEKLSNSNLFKAYGTMVAALSEIKHAHAYMQGERIASDIGRAIGGLLGPGTGAASEPAR